MTRPRKLAFIPGFVHAYVASWLCEVIGETRTARAMGWTRDRVRQVVSGDERLRPEERDRLMVAFGAHCSDQVVVGEMTEDGG
jgi:hypothetical protein